MSIRHYSPRRNRRSGISLRSKTLLGIVLGIAIVLQIIYPLIDGELLRVVTIATVYWAAGAMALLVSGIDTDIIQLLGHWHLC